MKIGIYSISFDDSPNKYILETQDEIEKLKGDYYERISYLNKCFSFEENNYEEFELQLQNYMNELDFLDKEYLELIIEKIINVIVIDKKYLNKEFINRLLMDVML